MKEELNIVIIGKSGAGKSSFLNYLIEENHFKVGEGSPVTQAYFEDYEYESPDTHVKYHLYDTKGIEPTTTEECRLKILEEIERRDKLNMFEWIHTVYYCFDASAKRIQQFEVDFINQLKKHVSIVILLTKKDLVIKTDLDQLVTQIEKEIGNDIQIVPVCSVEVRTRKGSSVREGKEGVLKASFLGLWEKLANSYPRMQIEFLVGTQRFFSSSVFEWIKTRNNTEYSGIRNAEITIEFLTRYPLLGDATYENIKESRSSIMQMIIETNNYVSLISNKLAEINIDNVWANNDKVHREVFAFYQKVNKVKPNVLYSNLSKEALKTIKTYPLDSKNSKLLLLKNKLEKLYEEFNDTLFWDQQERLKISTCYNDYRDLVMRIGIELGLLINNFVTIYRTELLQYGQYCLKKNVKKENCDSIESDGNLDSDEKIYLSVLRACLADETIQDRERSMLDKLVTVLDIPYTRAGLIEDYARRS